MKSETKIWLDYAEENLKSSKILLGSLVIWVLNFGEK